MAGEYTALVLAAQADQDQPHRQRAMDMIAAIAPMSGGGNEAADAMAAAVLAQLYPPDSAPPVIDLEARMAEIEDRYLQQAAAIVRSHVHGGHPAAESS